MRPLRWRRWLVLRMRALWHGLRSRLGFSNSGAPSYVDAHASVTFRALTNAVVPETPALADELGPEHEAGGLAIGLDSFAIVFADNLFQFGLPHVGPRGNLPISVPVAHALDVAALKLLARRRNESDPSPDRAFALYDDRSSIDLAAAVGPFAMLSRRDRLRAIALLGEFEVETAPFRGMEIEFDGGVVGQLVVGFTELLYYSEWEGYKSFERPPSERSHPNDPSAVQSWRQTDFPGATNGYAALRGYVGAEGSPLGAGEEWTVLDTEADSRVAVVRESGSFQENDYDTSGYEEPYPEGE